MTTTDEAVILRLIDAIRTVGPHIETLKKRVVNDNDRATFELIQTLVQSASGLIEDIDDDGFLVFCEPSIDPPWRFSTRRY